jgi:glycosyltransferase involved in cell wall biosynthesis
VAIKASQPIPATVKIVHLISDLSTGGAEMMLFRLLSHMDHSRYKNTVISLTDLGTLGTAFESLGICVYTLGKRQESRTNAIGVWQSLYLAFIGLWKLVCLLRKERPTILQTWLYHSDLLGLVSGKLARVPAIVWNLRCTNLKSERKVAMRMLALMSAYPQAVFVNSSAGREFHEARGYRPKKWVHIPNGFDLDTFRPDPDARRRLKHELRLSEATLLIGLIARIDPLKDHGNFLQGVQMLIDQQKDAHFVLAGLGVDNQNRDLVNEIKALGISSRVHLLGERRDIPQVMAALDILTSSSCAEGFPNVVGEAMACGVPCVVTDVGDSAWLVGETGIVVPAKSPAALAHAWAQLIQKGADGRHRLGTAARQRIKEHFDLAVITKRYERSYQELASIVA